MRVLAGIAGARDQMRLLEQGMVVFAVEWVKLNPGETLCDLPYRQKHRVMRADAEEALWEELSDQGCLRVDDFSIPEFAIAAGISEYAARKLIRESLMLVCLLPRVWARVVAGGVEVWRARLLASDCWDLSPNAVEFIDRHMAGITARFTLPARESLIAEAKRRYLSQQVAAEETAALERRGVHLGEALPDDHGVMPLRGRLDTLDGLDVDHTQPWLPGGAGGATCTCLLTPLCRRHHRLKTVGDNAGAGHSQWSVVPLGGGDYRWAGPGGIILIRTNQGTWDASVAQTAGGPRHGSTRSCITATENHMDTLLRASLTRPVHEAARVVEPRPSANNTATRVAPEPEPAVAVSRPGSPPRTDEDRYTAALAEFTPHSPWRTVEEYYHQFNAWHSIVVPRIPRRRTHRV